MGVRRDVPSFLNAAFGRAGIPYRYLVVSGLCNIHAMFDWAAGYLRAPPSSLEWSQLLGCLHVVSCTFCLSPVLVALAFDLAWCLVQRCNSSLSILVLIFSVIYTPRMCIEVTFWRLNVAQMPPIVSGCIWHVWFVGLVA